MGLLLTLAWAGEPTHCVVNWSGAAPACAVTESFMVNGTGLSEASAERSTRSTLEEILDLSADAKLLMTPALGTESFRGCSAAAKTAPINCFPEATLKEDKLCFVLFPNKSCWDGTVLSFENRVWRALDEGRDMMCSATDAYLVEQNYSDLEEHRALCAVSCLQEVVVKCP